LEKRAPWKYIPTNSAKERKKDDGELAEMRTKDFFREILLQITSMAIEIVSISMKEGSKSIQVVVSP